MSLYPLDPRVRLRCRGMSLSSFIVRATGKEISPSRSTCHWVTHSGHMSHVNFNFNRHQPPPNIATRKVRPQRIPVQFWSQLPSYYQGSSRSLSYGLDNKVSGERNVLIFDFFFSSFILPPCPPSSPSQAICSRLAPATECLW